MKLKVLTYNLFFGVALPDAKKLIEQEKPDIICVQELPTTYKSLHYLETKKYKLVSWTNTFLKMWKIFGNAVYINTETCELIKERNETMPSSTYDLWTFIEHGMHISRRFTQATVLLKETKKTIDIFNIHLTHLSLVELRLSQLKTVFEVIQKEVPKEQPVLIAGDFNLYNGKTELEKMLVHYGLQEATTNLAFTFEHKLAFMMMKLKLDYILYRKLGLKSTKRCDMGLSDHHPVVSEFEV